MKIDVILVEIHSPDNSQVTMYWCCRLNVSSSENAYVLLYIGFVSTTAQISISITSVIMKFIFTNVDICTHDSVKCVHNWKLVCLWLLGS